MKLTEEELDRLEGRAEERGVTVQGLLVSSALSDEIDNVRDVRHLVAELMKVQRLVGNTADNMNQIARHANTVHEVPSDFRPAVAQARSAWFKCEEILAGFARFERRVGL